VGPTCHLLLLPPSPTSPPPPAIARAGVNQLSSWRAPRQGTIGTRPAASGACLVLEAARGAEEAVGELGACRQARGPNIRAG
jgi:hypothetical protein